jgi:hypothetical protein
MNRRARGLVASKAIVGFVKNKTAGALSPRTIESYRHHLAPWIEYAHDPVVAKVQTSDVRAYLAWLMT